jgi:riboflavin kinase/FMN adenylyltransferase
LLGYPYSLTGTVVAGKQIGRKIGFPTANLSVPQEKLIPAAGVYACEEDGHKALLNIGTNPTVNGTEQTIELHLLDFTGDLYGKRMNVKLLRFIRADRKFDSIDDLRRQIQSDVEALK